MSPLLYLHNFILGENRFIPSHTQYKRVILTGELCLIAILICVIYINFGIFYGLTTTWYVLALLLLSSTICFVVNRAAHYNLAKILLATTTNAGVFALCLIEPFEAGLYTFFITCGLGALAVFGYEERKKSMFFVVVSGVLFLTALALAFDTVADPIYTHDYIRINMIVNFIGCFISCLMIIWFLMNVNHHAEKGLRENEEQIRLQNEELIKVNAELDRFVYSTSHDLRAPISSLQGLIQLIRMTDNPAEVSNYVNIMQGRLSNLTRFISDISDYSRNARIELQLKEATVNVVIANILESLRFYPGAEKLVVTTDMPDPMSMITDPVRLHIILSNLITNAFKYVDQSKETNWLKISVCQDAAHSRFVIEDNGVGIRAEYQTRIFEMFFQGTEKSEGSGLGLYIVREAINKLGGKIEVFSEFGNGARFTVVLPAHDGPPT